MAIETSKIDGYAVLAPPDGIVTAKFCVYVVLNNQANVAPTRSQKDFRVTVVS